MKRTSALAVALTTLIMTAQAHAQNNALPKAVQAAVDESRKACEPDTSRLLEGFVSRRDVNGDKIDDYILNYDAFECGGSTTFFCGTAGCTMQVFVSMPDATFANVLDENVRNVRFTQVKGRPAMVLALHGNACGKAGVAACSKTLIWDGKAFSARR